MAVRWRMNYTGAADCVAAGAKNSGSQRQAGGQSTIPSGGDTTVAWPMPVSDLAGGRRGLSITIPNNYIRYEFTPPDAVNAFADGDTAYFGFAFRCPAPFPEDATYYQVIAQVHAASGRGSPPIAFEVLNNELQLSGGANKPKLDGTNWGAAYSYRRTLLTADQLNLDQWYDVVWGCNFSATPGGGWVDVFVDGRKVVDHFAPPGGTVYTTSDASDGGSSYVKWGIYHGETIPGLTLLEAGHAIGDTFADVDSRPIGSPTGLRGVRPQRLGNPMLAA